MLANTVRLTLRLCLLLLASSAFAATDLTLEEILQRHLDSIGTLAARTAAKSRVVEGTVAYRVLVGGSGRVDGKAVMVSEGRKLQLMLKVVTLKYHGERFMSDGDKTFVEGTYDDHSRSEFGQFLRSEDLALREGLLGGTLSEAWPLLNWEASKGKLKYQGRKNLDGHPVEVVSYQAKKGSDMDVTLYFDSETYRHVMTMYKVSQHAGLAPNDTIAITSQETALVAPGSSDAESSQRLETHYQIEERFSDFKSADGLTLPSHYDLRFSEELTSGFTKAVQWDVTTTRVLSNVTLDPRNFQIP
jgi:hypothetical protein